MYSIYRITYLYYLPFSRSFYDYCKLERVCVRIILLLLKLLYNSIIVTLLEGHFHKTGMIYIYIY